MYLYTFVNQRWSEPFLDWLSDTCGRRYRLIRDLAGRMRRRKSLWQRKRRPWRLDEPKKRHFHSQQDCYEGGWARCPLSRVHFEPIREELDQKRYFSTAFPGFETRYAWAPPVITVIFDQIGDFVHCKLRWSDLNYRVDG